MTAAASEVREAIGHSGARVGGVKVRADDDADRRARDRLTATAESVYQSVRRLTIHVIIDQRLTVGGGSVSHKVFRFSLLVWKL